MMGAEVIIMSEYRSQNGIGGMSWPTAKEGLVDDSGKTLDGIREFSSECPKCSRCLYFFLLLFFRKTQETY